MYYSMRGATAVDMAKAVADVQSVVGYCNSNLDTSFRAGVGLAGPVNRLVIVGGYPDLDSLMATQMKVAADAEVSRQASAMAANTESGSGTRYVIRHLHGSTESGRGDYVYFRAVQHLPGRMGDALPNAMSIVDHLTETHGWAMSLGTPLGVASDTLLYATRFQTPNAVDEAFTTLMADEGYQQLATGSSLELVQNIEDRFIMMMPN